MSKQQPIPVTGIMLRNAGDELIVEAEINGVWVVVIREFIGPVEFAVSHIVEPLGMQRRYDEQRDPRSGAEKVSE